MSLQNEREHPSMHACIGSIFDPEMACKGISGDLIDKIIQGRWEGAYPQVLTPLPPPPLPGSCMLTHAQLDTSHYLCAPI